MTDTADDDLLDIERTAKLCGEVSIETIRWLRSRGRFPPAVRIGRRLFWRRDDISAWLASQREAGGEA